MGDLCGRLEFTENTKLVMGKMLKVVIIPALLSGDSHGPGFQVERSSICKMQVGVPDR